MDRAAAGAMPITNVMVRTRDGNRMAVARASPAPMEAPMTWAESQPSASMTATPSAAMSAAV